MYKILISDDHQEMNHAYQEMFNENEYESFFVQDPEHVFQEVEANRPDILIINTNYKEPVNMTAEEVLKKVREKYPMETLPVIVVSQESNTGSYLKLIQLDINDYIVRPIANADALIDSVLDVIERYKI